jgi:hypothetical protein
MDDMIKAIEGVALASPQVRKVFLIILQCSILEALYSSELPGATCLTERNRLHACSNECYSPQHQARRAAVPHWHTAL